MTNDTLQQNIIATICFHDVLDYPLTGFEVWKHLINATYASATEPRAVTLGDVREALRDPDVTKHVSEKNGFYFLHGREVLCEERLRKNRIALHKVRRLRRVVWLLRAVPFVRGVLATGGLAMKHTRGKSDLDVLIILAGGHIWTGRFLVTLLTQLLGKRKHGRKHRDHVCLNYFVTDESLEVPTKDLFAAHEYTWTFPLFGADVFRRFQFANSWAQRFKPHYAVADIPHQQCLSDHGVARSLRVIGESLLKFMRIETQMRAVQKKKIAANKKTHLPGACIIANDRHLVFLPKPHGPVVEEEFKKRFAKIDL